MSLKRQLGSGFWRSCMGEGGEEWRRGLGDVLQLVTGWGGSLVASVAWSLGDLGHWQRKEELKQFKRGSWYGGWAEAARRGWKIGGSWTTQESGQGGAGGGGRAGEWAWQGRRGAWPEDKGWWAEKTDRALTWALRKSLL